MDLQKLSDPATPPGEIRRAYSLLSMQQGEEMTKTMRLIASNPNTPKDVLGALLWEFFQDVMANPAVALLQLEQPNWLGEALEGIKHKKPYTLPEPMRQQLQRIRDPQTQRSDIHSLLIPWSLMDTHQIPPVMDAFGFALMKRPDFVLADLEGVNGLRCLLAIGRRIDARRLTSDQGWQPSIGDRGWNPFCLMQYEPSLDEIGAALQMLLKCSHRKKGAWEKELANVSRSVCALLGYTVLTRYSQGISLFGRAAIDVGSRAVLGMRVLKGDVGPSRAPYGAVLQPQDIQGVGTVVAWLYETFPFLPKPNDSVCRLGEHDKLGRAALLEGLRKKLGCADQSTLAQHPLLQKLPKQLHLAYFQSVEPPTPAELEREKIQLAARFSRFKSFSGQRLLNLGFRLQDGNWWIEFGDRPQGRSRVSLVPVVHTVLLVDRLGRLSQNPTFEELDALLYELRAR